jgi:methylmalonyl-CoA mutase N-terminal domain/subunit
MRWMPSEESVVITCALTGGIHGKEANPPQSEARKIEGLRQVRCRRDEHSVTEGLQRLQELARDPSANLMPATIEAVTADATMGEIVKALEAVFGCYTETSVF